VGINYSPKIVTNGLVLCLDAANSLSYPGSGTVWTDLSGNGNNGTLTNGPTYSSANRGSIVFDGSNDYVLTTRPSQIIASGAISIALWAKWTTSGNTTSTIQTLVDNNHAGSPNRGFVIQDRPDLSKILTFSVRPSGVGARSNAIIGDNNWHFIVGTNDTSTSALYIDGVLNATTVESGGIPSVTNNISIGYWQGGTRYMNGIIPQVLIYNRALSASEVQQNYNATKGRFNL